MIILEIHDHNNYITMSVSKPNGQTINYKSYFLQVHNHGL